MADFPVSLQLNIPFQNREQATIAEKSLSPDPVLKPDQSQISYSITETAGVLLNIVVRGRDDRIVRVTVNNLLENLKTIIECFEEFEIVSK